jgi:crotonobetainyl-CoA:carnitine CoA-transferase CaiB-like acyl-CoA transferase
MTGPLSHIRVLDLSRIMAGPWAGQLMADLGADVIKVERPDIGDDTRGWGPPFLKDSSGKETRESGYYLSVNRGKRSIALDLDKPEGQKVVRALAARSDIVLENFKAGTLARYGLDYDALKKIKPDIIYCSITGFGQTGPRKDNPAYDFMIQAMCGLMSVTGEGDERPGGGPQKVGVPIVDLMTGMYATVSVLAALARRNETGHGDHIDLAMLDVGVGFLANQAMNYLVSGKPPRRSGNAHPNIQPQDVFAARDGHIAIVVGNPGQYAQFCTVIERPDLVSDPRFVDNAERVRRRDELKAIIEPILKSRDMAHWIAALAQAGVPCGPINTVPMILADEQIVHRKMRVDIPHPAGVAVPQIVSPMKFREASLRLDRAPPMLGEHTDEILKELGL